MKERLIPLAILFCCLFALATSAGSIESAVSTNPDEVVDYDSRLLPVGIDTVRDLKQQLQGKSAGSDGSETTATASESGPPREVTATSRSERSSASSSESKDESSSASAASDSKSPSDPSDWLQRLLALLKAVLVGLLVIALIAVAGAVAYDRREELLARLDALAASDGEPEDPDRAAEADPSNAVEEAWYRMLDEFDLTDARSKTPEECAREAIERGAERAAVRPLTEVFTEVRYGGAPVDESRRQRAEESLRLCVQRTDGGESES